MVLTKLSLENPLKYNQVYKLQRSRNSTISRSTKRTPFEIMLDVMMSNPEDFNLNKILEEEIINEFENRWLNTRNEAKEVIKNIQKENHEKMDIYEVRKVGNFEGQITTSTSADMMKPRITTKIDQSSESDD